LAIEVPTLLVHGNNETHTQLWRACGDWPSAIVLHGTGRTIDGVPFYGWGMGRATRAGGLDAGP
jgi:hypothetical protein